MVAPQSLEQTLAELARVAPGGSAEYTAAVLLRQVQELVARAASELNVIDYGATGDGSHDDSSAIQAALDAVPSRGGVVTLPPGLYRLSSGLVITENKRIRIRGAGAVLLLDAGVTGLTIHQGSTGGNRRGVFVEDLRIAGQNSDTCIGVLFTDTNWSGLYGVQIEDCGRGIVMWNQDANEFVEGIALVDTIVRNSGVYGLEYRRTSGTNSFGQHNYRNFSVNVKASAVGVYIPTSCSVYRSFMDIGCWIPSSAIAFDFDGDFDGAIMKLHVEGSTGATGNTGIIVRANATALEQSNNYWYFTGDIATPISNGSSLLFAYEKGRRKYGVTNTAPVQVFKHGVVGAYVSLGFGGSAGGQIIFGDQGSGDCEFHRSGADVISSADRIQAADSFTVKTKAGIPTDGDFLHTPPDGTVIVDTSNHRWYVRSGGSWKYAALT